MAERIAVADLEVGMELGRAVLDPEGAEILPAGLALDAGDIDLLRQCAVYAWVCAEPGDSAKPGRRNKAERARLVKRIGKAFARHAENPRMQVLRRIATNHLVGGDGDAEGGEAK